jgi:ABC-type Zn uptake system ZnuABC Zn-binding protein ZnuA
MIREQGVKAVVAEPWADRRLAELVARDGGARLLMLPASVGGADGVKTYLELMERLVAGLAAALG